MYSIFMYNGKKCSTHCILTSDIFSEPHRVVLLTQKALLGFKSLYDNKKRIPIGILFCCLSKTKLYIYVAKSEKNIPLFFR